MPLNLATAPDRRVSTVPTFSLLDGWLKVKTYMLP